MGYKEKEIVKLYYSIGEVAEMMNVNTSLIRYWEKEFDLLKPKKSANGERSFTKEDIAILQLIYHLVRERGFTLDGAKLQLKSNLKTAQRHMLIVQKLQHLRQFLVEMKEQL
jgi:DNA-binding transcriptional MerR regulator